MILRRKLPGNLGRRLQKIKRPSDASGGYDCQTDKDKACADALLRAEPFADHCGKGSTLWPAWPRAALR